MVLAQHQAGTLKLAPPTWVLVSELAACFRTFESLRAEVRSPIARDMRYALLLAVARRRPLCVVVAVPSPSLALARSLARSLLVRLRSLVWARELLRM